MSAMSAFTTRLRMVLLLVVFGVSSGLTGCLDIGGGDDDPDTVSDVSGGDDSSDDDSDDSDSGGRISLNGVALATQQDAATVATVTDFGRQLLHWLSPVSRAVATDNTGASGNTTLADAEVTLFRMFSDGTEEEVDIGEVITDSEGEFEIPDIDPAPAGSGSDSDFYYEIRITKGSLELRSPVAPLSDEEVNVTPESDLAAAILSDVVSVPGNDEPPLPSAASIDAMRELASGNAAELIDGGSIELPTATAGADELTTAMANGLASAGGSAEDMFHALSFESEYLALSNDDTSTGDDYSSFIKRLTLQACEQNDGDYMPQVVADALGEYMAAGNTVTLQELLTAYSEAGGSADAENVMTELDMLIEDLQDILGMGLTDELSSIHVMGLYGRLAEIDDLSLTTELSAEQAFLIALIMQQGDSDRVCALQPSFDLYSFVSGLTGDDSVTDASVAEIELYHNSGFGCNEGDGEGHFVARVSVYSAGKNLDGVTITSSDSTALGGDGTITLTSEGSDWISNTDGVCVALGTEVRYTVTASFTDTTTATTTINRNHPRIPEATSQVLVDEVFVDGSGDSATPTVVATTRPLYQWTSPADMLASVINDAANADISTTLAAGDDAVKYTYEFAHVNLSESPVSPINSGTYPACTTVSSGALYAVDSFLPTQDCDVSACAEALGTDPENIACRMNIQSYLVDEYDSLLGQAAGHFRFFCVDTDDDGECG